tara:strand:- start:203 stop:895 length:693 start_codon:yes stop_codon:yes gene_type:complete
MDLPLALTTNSLRVTSLRQYIFNEILKSIFTGEFEAGTRLKIQYLAKRYGVSSTPLREAIIDLCGVGFAQFSLNRGAVVSAFGPQQIRDIYQVRRILEVESVHCACDCRNLKDIEEVYTETINLQVADRDENWFRRCTEIDKKTHLTIVNAAGNSHLKHEIIRYERLMNTINLIMEQDKHYEDFLSEHLEILEAMIHCDQKSAGEAMSNHINAAGKRTVEWISSLVEFQQ